MQKKSIKFDLPIQLGFFVYGYAKLKMLQFKYDVIDRFISRDDYCLLEMDTGETFMRNIIIYVSKSQKSKKIV